MQKNEIFRICGTDYKAMTIELLTEAELISHIPEKACRIGIKPNLVSPTPASYGGTTHPEVVEGIIEYLLSCRDFNIVILESSWVGDKTPEAFEVCGYNDLSEKYGIPLIDLQKDSWHTVNCAGMDLLICDEVSKLDFLINVPVLKGHCQTKITCALKNLKGLIPNKEKRHFHSMGLHKPIAHLNAGIRQDFIVVDHICGDLDFEDGGHPVIRNCIMAGCDPVLMDSYVCRLLHYETDAVPYIRMADKLGAGSSDLTGLKLHLLGDQAEEELPRSDKVIELSDAVEEVDSCSACYGYLLPALDRLREEGLWEELRRKLPGRICIGQGWREKTGAVGIGNCTGHFDFCVPGCPPTEDQIYEALKAYLSDFT